MFLLDTDTVLYYFKGRGNVTSNLMATSPKNVAISTITLCEIDVGMLKSPAMRQRRKLLAELEAAITVLPFARDEALAAAQVRASLEQVGTPIGPMDTLIAGTALAAKATLVTHNQAEFSRVRGLSLVDWF